MKKIKERERCEARVRKIEKFLNAGKYNVTYLVKDYLLQEWHTHQR
jgi:hypothetical protein